MVPSVSLLPRARTCAPDPVRTSGSPVVIRTLVALLTAVACAVSGLNWAPSASAAPLSPALSGLAQGVDTSIWQHPGGAPIDWKTAAGAGTSFAFIKATDGVSPGNDFYETDVEQARAAGIVVGSYHKAHPAQDATQQARVFARQLQSVGGPQLPPVLDIEIDEGLSPAQLVTWTRTFLTETQRLTGRTPIVYTYRYFWLLKMGNTTEFTSYPLWIAEYGKPEPTFPLVGGWTEWTFWQRAGNDGRHPGFSTAIDLNVFAGSREDLQAWIGPVTPSGDTDPSPSPAPKPKPKPVAPVARDEVTTGTGSAIPTKITIPAIPGVELPPGISLPMTLTIPPQLLDGAGSLDGNLLGLLDQLPLELLRSAEIS